MMCLRNRMNFTFAPLAWVAWCLGSVLMYPLRAVVRDNSLLTGLAWFAAYAAMMVWFVVLGPTGGR